MLNYRLLVLLLAINTALPLKKDTKLGKKPQLPKQTNCKIVKCPAVEQPICAKLVYKNAGNRTVYVVMVNKCEMNYVKCHEGLEAVVVPMKNCGHDHLIKRSKRTKRDVKVIPEDMPAIEHLILKLDDDEETKVHNAKIDDNIENNDQPGNTEYNDENQGGEETTNDDENDGDAYYYGDTEYNDENTDKDGIDYDNYKDTHYYYGYDDNYEYGGHDDDNYEGEEDYDYYNGDELYEEDYESDEEYVYPEEYGVSSDYDYKKELLNAGFGVDLTGDLEDNVFHNPNGGSKIEEVNIKEYFADCPTVCPSRDVMVCARCQHGVFRTFLTICHMRMFGCRHTDESLELIARRPCVMSAPYLSDVSMTPTGRVREPNDDDRVLRFIRCREKTKMSREGDPRCSFSKDEETKMMLDTFRVDDNY